MKVSTGKIHTIMKTKNIFLTAISALFIFAACTEEKIMDEPGVSGKGDLVIELSPSSVITKAAAEDKGYVYATEEELNVEDCWIFVFGENEKYITSPRRFRFLLKGFPHKSASQSHHGAVFHLFPVF